MSAYTPSQLEKIVESHKIWDKSEGQAGKHADFRGADLSEADLSFAYLKGAIFTNADLTGVNLTGAHLDWAYFHGADLTRAILPEEYTHLAEPIVSDEPIGWEQGEDPFGLHPWSYWPTNSYFRGMATELHPEVWQSFPPLLKALAEIERLRTLEQDSNADSESEQNADADGWVNHTISIRPVPQLTTFDCRWPSGRVTRMDCALVSQRGLEPPAPRRPFEVGDKVRSTSWGNDITATVVTPEYLGTGGHLTVVIRRGDRNTTHQEWVEHLTLVTDD